MNIAIIPARGGSTRIKNKNFKYFFGKPVISYSIATALNSKLFSEVIVSTDNEKLIYVSKKAGAKVFFKRPNYLSKNNIPIIDVVSHAIKELKKNNFEPTNVCCIFPVSPLLTKEMLIKGLSYLKKKKLNYVFPVTNYTNSNLNKLIIHNGKISKNKIKGKIFFDAGQFYWGKTSAWKKKLKIFGSNSGVLNLSSSKLVDVNIPSDWQILKKNYLIVKNKKKYEL